MMGVWSVVLSIAILAAVIVAAAVVLYLTLGRRKKGEDKMVGGLDTQAVFKGGGNNNPGNRTP